MTKAKTKTVPLDQLIGARFKEAVKLESGRGAGFRRVLARFLGKEWERQTVYEAGQGRRKFRVSELVAFARATNRPGHYFLDAADAGVEMVEVDPDAEPISADELRNLFRIQEPRDTRGDVDYAVRSIEGVLEDLAAQANELRYVAHLLSGALDAKEGKKS